MKKVSIIIVNYNTTKLLDNCIKSIYDNCKNRNYEIIVVDNNSNDKSIKLLENKYEEVIFIYNSENYGFGKFNNIGAKASSGEYLLLLNSDTIVRNNIVDIFMSYYEAHFRKKSIGCLGAWLYDKDDNITNSIGHFPTVKEVIPDYFKIIFKYMKKHNANRNSGYQNSINNSEGVEVEYVVGALIFIKKDLFYKMKGFDEQFFMYFEETDLQNRLKNKGYKNIILNSPNVIHLEGKSPFISNKKRIVYSESMYKYFKKRISKIEYIFFKVITLILRMPTFFSGKYKFKENIEFFSKIIKV